MCIHNRIVYTCGHFGWADEVRVCNVQEAFQSGCCSEECDTMHSHPLKTYKVQKLCKTCDEKKKKMEGTVSRLKTAIVELNESVQRLRKEEATGT
jgi:hypothetical protein